MNQFGERIHHAKMYIPRMIRAGWGVLSAVLVCSSCTHSASLSGTLQGVESDTLLVISSLINESTNFRKDTVALVDHTFELQYPDSALNIFIIAQPKSPNAPLRMPVGGPLVFLPGDKLHVEGSIDNFKISGSELYDGIASYKDIVRMQDEVHALNDAYSKAYAAKDELEKVRIKKEVKAVYDSLMTRKFEVVKSHPNTLVAAYFTTQLDAERGLEALDLLPVEIKNGPMSGLIKRAQKSFESRIIRESAKANIQPGKMAPDFKLTTIKGKEISLSSFHGKYLLVDFWGTWCGWCIKGIPDMKKYYKKYHEHIEFLGVSCGDTDSKWRNGVKRYELPWVNVREGESNLAARFAVDGYPTKVLLDSEGKIVEKFVGEGPELYERLEQLFGE